ncbi:MAG: hypothetical protein DWQ01_00585 [Planctomycetota bacterium]|nr:MAG: hypothetical protein DWQ01_00585 [Planctomycetota bacterium]
MTGLNCLICSKNPSTSVATLYLRHYKEVGKSIHYEGFPLADEVTTTRFKEKQVGQMEGGVCKSCVSAAVPRPPVGKGLCLLFLVLGLAGLLVAAVAFGLDYRTDACIALALVSFVAAATSAMGVAVWSGIAKGRNWSMVEGSFESELVLLSLGSELDRLESSAPRGWALQVLEDRPGCSWIDYSIKKKVAESRVARSPAARSGLLVVKS